MEIEGTYTELSPEENQKVVLQIEQQFQEENDHLLNVTDLMRKYIMRSNSLTNKEKELFLTVPETELHVEEVKFIKPTSPSKSAIHMPVQDLEETKVKNDEKEELNNNNVCFKETLKILSELENTHIDKNKRKQTAGENKEKEETKTQEPVIPQKKKKRKRKKKKRKAEKLLENSTLSTIIETYGHPNSKLPPSDTISERNTEEEEYNKNTIQINTSQSSPITPNPSNLQNPTNIPNPSNSVNLSSKSAKTGNATENTDKSIKKLNTISSCIEIQNEINQIENENKSIRQTNMRKLYDSIQTNYDLGFIILNMHIHIQQLLQQNMQYKHAHIENQLLLKGKFVLFIQFRVLEKEKELTECEQEFRKRNDAFNLLRSMRFVFSFL
jgi:hypothetical protein